MEGGDIINLDNLRARFPDEKSCRQFFESTITKKGLNTNAVKELQSNKLLVAVERNGPVRATPVASDKIAELSPQLDRFVDKEAHLMTDENHSYQSIGRHYAALDYINHSQKEYARGEVHNLTTESFSEIIERAKQGVFHYLNTQHLRRYLNEIGFRWGHRIPELKLTKNGDLKIVMRPMPVIQMLRSLLFRAQWRQLRRSANGGFLCHAPL